MEQRPGEFDWIRFMELESTPMVSSNKKNYPPAKTLELLELKFEL